MKTTSILSILIAFSCLAVRPSAQAQDCKTNEELDAIPGKYQDAAHYEWPAARASWFDDLKTAANKATANKVLTRIEGIERDSRKNFTLTGAILKSTFSGDAADDRIASYSINLGVYEYFCARGKTMLNSEYENVFRAYVNQFKGLPPAFGSLDDNTIALHEFLRFKDKKLLEAMNAGIGFYQDVKDESVKQGSRSTYITRHWYITKPGQPLFVPVSRKEYLNALLEFYEKESQTQKQTNNNNNSTSTSRKLQYANYQSQYEAKKAAVTAALKQHGESWLSAPAVVCPKPVTNWTYDKNLGWSYNGQGIADSEADGIRTGSFTFSGFWDDRGGDILYKYNPAYFKPASLASAPSPAKPQFIELSFRYVRIPVGQRLVDNFTKNFDFKAVQQLLE